MAKTDAKDVPVANIAPFGLRMQPEFKRKMEDAAKRSGRSLNSEIIARLERSLEDDSVTTGGISVADEIEALRAQIRHEADERTQLVERIARLERAGPPDLYDIKTRLYALERKI